MATTPGAGSRILQVAKQKLADIASAQRAKASDAHASKPKQTAKPVAKPADTKAAKARAPMRASKADTAAAVTLATPTKTTTRKSSTARVASDAKANKPAAPTSRKAAPKAASATATSAQAVRVTPSKRATSAGSSQGATKPGAKPRASRITPAQALANTQKLLAAKNEQARQPQVWQNHDGEHTGPAETDFQSPEAMVKATELHSGESYKSAIQGSIGTQDRHNQGKRDSR